MAYESTGLTLMFSPFSRPAPSLWSYYSTADSSATIAGTGYFTQAGDGKGGRGVRVGDYMMVNLGTAASLHAVTSSSLHSTSYSSGIDVTIT